MNKRFVELAVPVAAAFVLMFGATACAGAVEEEVQQRVEEEVQEEQQQLEEQVQEATQRIEQEVQEVRKQVQEKVGEGQ